MPEGQFTGTRSSYIYTADDGTTTILQVDDTLAGLTGTGLISYTGQAVDGLSVLRFTPRIVYWESDDKTKRKRIICGDVTGTLYSKVTSAALTIDGVAGKTTGRRGEKLSYLKAKAVV